MVSRVHKYADGGKIVTKKPAPPPPPDPSRLGSGMVGKAADTLANRRKKQMDELGLKDGGKVRGRKR